ncbi:hypothetical protein AVEN_41289-1 [Araneus ventricosus]|uniref:Uncharacterized protein n=1 Tax=Araneus ventricosus TaxID=182803 RepID=A0A4Y2MBW0_ARAVE|nr:hypothetical protein AVEN_41289-1 [Araneus ventricosus]
MAETVGLFEIDNKLHSTTTCNLGLLMTQKADNASLDYESTTDIPTHLLFREQNTNALICVILASRPLRHPSNWPPSNLTSLQLLLLILFFLPEGKEGVKRSCRRFSFVSASWRQHASSRVGCAGRDPLDEVHLVLYQSVGYSSNLVGLSCWGQGKGVTPWLGVRKSHCPWGDSERSDKSG